MMIPTVNLQTAASRPIRNNLGLPSDRAAAPQGDFLRDAVDGKKAQKTVSGTVDVYRNEFTAVRASILLKQAAAEHSLSVVTWRGIGFAMGALAGGVNGTLNLLKARDSYQQEQDAATVLYIFSGGAFLGTLGTGLALTVGALARRMIIKGALQTAVVRLGAQFATEAAVASLSGWGLLLLGAAVLFELGAVLLTPTEMQVWARKSRFGTNSQDKFANAKEEWEALQKLLAPKEESKPSSGQVAAKRALILPPVGLAVPLFAEMLVEYWLDQQKAKAKSGASAK